MLLYTGFYSTSSTQKNKHAMVKCTGRLEIGRRNAEISSIFSGKAGIHKLFHPGKQSITEV